MSYKMDTLACLRPTIEEIVDKLLTQKIQEYCEGKLIGDHDKFAMLELNYEKLKTFMENLKMAKFPNNPGFSSWIQCKKLNRIHLLTPPFFKNDLKFFLAQIENFVDTSSKPKIFKERS